MRVFLLSTYRIAFCGLLYGTKHLAWASYQIRKIAGCACAGNAGNVFPRRRIQRKTRVSDPGMHHGTCVTHVPWCMSGLLTRGGGENVPGIPGACAPATLRIWQEAHGMKMGVVWCALCVCISYYAFCIHYLVHDSFWGKQRSVWILCLQ